MPFAQPVNEGGVGDTPGPDQWFKSLPFVTRCWFGATIILTLSVNFGIISGYQVVWSWTNVKSKFELWRILTPFCYAGAFDFSTMISVYMLVQFSKQYESGGPFNTGAGGGTADYAFMMILGVVGTLVTYPLLLGFFALPPVFCRNMIYYVLYTWSKRNPTAPANIWGFQMQAIYLPFAYLAFSVFIGNSYMDMIFGMAIGHIYYFLVDVVPVVYGKDVLNTPQFLIEYFGVGEYNPQQPAPAAAAPRFGGVNRPAAAAAGGGGGGGGHNWGSGGQTLGRN